MRLKLEYDNGEVKAKRVEDGREYELREEGLSSLFSPYYHRMKKYFEEEMRRMGQKEMVANNVLESTLTIDIKLKGGKK